MMHAARVVLAIAAITLPAAVSAQARPPGPDSGGRAVPARDGSSRGDRVPDHGQSPSQASSPEEEGTSAEERPPGAVVAQEVRDPKGLPTAVLVLAGTGVDGATADALTEVAIGALAARGGGSIVGKEEFQARLGQGETLSLECVGSPPCLGRVGVELGVGQVVAGTVGRRQGGWVFHLHRIDIRTGEVVGRVFREVPGNVTAVAAAIQEAVPALYEEAAPTASLAVVTDVPGAEVRVDGAVVGVARGKAVQVPSLEPGLHEVVVRASGHQTWRRQVELRPDAVLQLDVSLVPAPPPPARGRQGRPQESSEVGEPSTGVSPLVWVGLGTGVAALGTATYFGVSSRQELHADSTRTQALSFVDDRRRDARIANGLFGVAAAGVATVAIGLLLSDFSPDRDSGTTWTVTPVERGLVVGWEARR